MISSVLSAVVAYLVASRQMKLAQEKDRVRNNRYERILLYELKENAKVLDRKKSLIPDKTEYVEAISKLINFDVWNSLRDKIDFSDDMIEPVFKAYQVLNTLKSEQEKESIDIEQFPVVVEKTQQRVQDAIKVISNKVE